MYSAEPLSHFVEQYLAYLYETLPTGAAFEGVHQFDDLLEDPSRAALEGQARELGGLARRLGAIAKSGLTSTERIEREMLDANIRARIFELEKVRSWERNPQRHAELLNRAGEASKAAGIKMGYHNHSFEFEQQEGKTGYETLLSLTEADLVAMELDLYWAVNASQDPVTWFQNHPGRFSMLHVKDMGSDGSMVDVGRGTIDFAELFTYADSAGFEHYFIEHDNPSDGINSIAYSYNSVNNIRF